jgi:hypothetical protein
MYISGGFYLDIKSVATRPLDEVLLPDDSFIVSGWKDPLSDLCFNATEYMQWFICSEPGHPYLKSTLEVAIEKIKAYDETVNGVGKNAVLALTGPHVFTTGIVRIEDAHPHRHALYMTDLGLKYTIFDSLTEHETLFSTHYSRNTLPLVAPF